MFRILIGSLILLTYAQNSFGQSTIDVRLTNYTVNGLTMSVDIEAQASSAIVLGGSEPFGPVSAFWVTYTDRGTAAGEIIASGISNTPTNYSIIGSDFNNAGNGAFRITMQIANGASFTIPTTYTRVGTVSFSLGAGTTTAHTVTLGVPANTAIYDENDVLQTDGTFAGLSNQQLPVNFSSFEVLKNHDKSELIWTTSIEKNNKGFEIERSTNGLDFQTIGFVDGKGNSLTSSTYNYDDYFVFSQEIKTLYYRLKQIDFDGAFIYTPTRTIAIDKNVELSWFPNPASTNINILSSNTQYIDIIDITGKTVLSTSTINQNKIDVSRFNKGTYLLLIKNQTGEVVKQDKLFIR